MLHAGMNVARFNFSHGSHEYHQGVLDNLREACRQTRIMCAVMLDTKVRGRRRVGARGEGRGLGGHSASLPVWFGLPLDHLAGRA